ncbi:GNAT family N-acetyltransferase [soil metagenome]
MSSPQIVIKSVAWDSPEAHHLTAVRFRVFVDEQRVPAEEEIDAFDPVAYHLLALADGAPVGAARLYEPPDQPDVGRIGRMAVLAEWRGHNIGRALLVELMRIGYARRYERLFLDAQLHAIGFYEKAGFTVCGGEHMDAGIPHRAMDIPRDEVPGVLSKFQLS